MGKPRMTRADAWKKRKPIERYWQFKDAIRQEAQKFPGWMLPSNPEITFYIPMPKSSGKKWQREMLGQPHQKKPDIDNLIKALLDALLDNDGHIWSVSAKKLWSTKGYIEIK